MQNRQLLARKYLGFSFIHTIYKNQDCPSKILCCQVNLKVYVVTVFMVLERKSEAGEFIFLDDAVTVQVWAGDYKALCR